MNLKQVRYVLWSSSQNCWKVISSSRSIIWIHVTIYIFWCISILWQRWLISIHKWFLQCNLNTVVPGFSVLGFRALPGFRALCTGNQIWIYVINLPGFSALPGFKAPFHGDGQSALNPGTTVSVCLIVVHVTLTSEYTEIEVDQGRHGYESCRN